MSKQNSIDAAISSVDEQINQHQTYAQKIFRYVIIFGLLILAAGSFVYLLQYYGGRNMLYEIRRTMEMGKLDSGGLAMAITTALQELKTDATILFAFLGVFIVVFGVLMAIYRFHLSEISRAHQYRFGLLRIRIAANNFQEQGFGTEVRQALTQNAFLFSTGKEKKLDSPLPGHPASDLGSLFINKFMESLEVKLKSKENT